MIPKYTRVSRSFMLATYRRMREYNKYISKLYNRRKDRRSIIFGMISSSNDEIIYNTFHRKNRMNLKEIYYTLHISCNRNIHLGTWFQIPYILYKYPLITHYLYKYDHPDKKKSLLCMLRYILGPIHRNIKYIKRRRLRFIFGFITEEIAKDILESEYREKIIRIRDLHLYLLGHRIHLGDLLHLDSYHCMDDRIGYMRMYAL